MTESYMIGKYPVSQKLGAGGMGEVWKGQHPELGIPVAIKIMSPHLIEQDPQFAERFLQEARTAMLISHTNVVRVFDAGAVGETFYMVMEYVDGETIDARLERDGPMAPEAAMALIIPIAQALESAAGHGIIHRDIKPENIMVDHRGEPKLCDLGLAKQTEGEYAQSMTVSGVVFGTPLYIAPEQASNARDVDARADIYSLGATLYHMVTGSVPFSGDSIAVVMTRHLRDPLPHPTTLAPSLPDNISSVICKMMEKEPDERYQSATDLLQDLQAIRSANASTGELICRDHSQVKQTSPRPRSAKAKPSVREPRPRKALYIAIGSGCLIGLVVLITMVASRPEDTLTEAKGDPASASAAGSRSLDEPMVSFPSQHYEDLAALGAGTIVPSVMELRSDRVRPVMVFSDQDHPLIGVATLGDSRAVVSAHPDLLDHPELFPRHLDALEVPDGATIWTNDIKRVPKFESALGPYQGRVAVLFWEGDFAAVPVKTGDVMHFFEYPRITLSDEDIAVAHMRIEEGAHLLTGALGWTMVQNNGYPVEDFPEFFINRLVSPYGVHFTAHAKGMGGPARLVDHSGEVRQEITVE